MNIYFIKKWFRRAFAGQYDFLLTEEGRTEALTAKNMLANIEFDKVYSSDLLRTVET